jgi:hypothetical protein
MSICRPQSLSPICILVQGDEPEVTPRVLLDVNNTIGLLHRHEILSRVGQLNIVAKLKVLDVEPKRPLLPAQSPGEVDKLRRVVQTVPLLVVI